MTRLRTGSKRLNKAAPVSGPELLGLIESVTQQLSQALPEAELVAGWSEPRSTRMRTLLLDVKAKLERHEPISSTPLVRLADHMSITSGRLLESICAIDVALNERVAK